MLGPILHECLKTQKINISLSPRTFITNRVKLIPWDFLDGRGEINYFLKHIYVTFSYAQS